MTACLLDVNVLVALAWPNHIAHARAVAWFMENRTKGFATCPITESGFVRVSMNPGIVSERISSGTVLAVLERYRAMPEHRFWPDDLPIGEALSAFDLFVGYGQVTDAYLLSLARRNEGCLVTFDQAVATLAPVKLRDGVIVIR